MNHNDHPAMTDAERIQRALFRLELDWGNGTFNYAALRAILAGKDD